MAMTTALEAGRPPQQLRQDLWLFPPNRDCQGGSSWWLDVDPEPVLIDCPPLTQASLSALQELAGSRTPRILLTSREGHGRLRRVQERLGWPVLVQEQEAYLLPNISPLDTFAGDHGTISGLQMLWTPGPTPGQSPLPGGTLPATASVSALLPVAQLYSTRAVALSRAPEPKPESSSNHFLQ